MVKGNNGRAARRRLVYTGLGYLVTLLCSLVLLLVIAQLAAPFVSQFLMMGRRPHHHHHHDDFNGGGGGNGRLAKNSWNFKLSDRLLQKLRRNKQRQDDGDDESAATTGGALGKEQVLEQILQGQLHLIDVSPNVRVMRQRQKMIRRTAEKDQEPQNSNNSNSNNDNNNLIDYANMFRGTFCHLDWSAHERDPSQTPMFRDIVQKSRCDKDDSPNVHDLDLYEVMQAIRIHDEKKQRDKNNAAAAAPHVVPLSGVVFHESRCGSTLLANLMQLHNPEENIVYSESAPPISVLRLADTLPKDEQNNNKSSSLVSQPLLAQVLRDVVQLMSRTDNPRKRRVFFKIQSIGTLSLPTFRRAFPTTPWIFVYRDPIEVLMSHLGGNGGGAGRHANCVRSQHASETPRHVQSVVTQYQPYVLPRDLGIEDYCAAHLAGLTETAVHQLQHAQLLASSESSTSLGMAVNYKDLPDLFIDTILPKVWKIDGGVIEESRRRMHEGSTSYSKGRGSMAGQVFQGDSQSKQEHASVAIHKAAQTFLQPSFVKLERLAKQVVKQ